MSNISISVKELILAQVVEENRKVERAALFLNERLIERFRPGNPFFVPLYRGSGFWHGKWGWGEDHRLPKKLVPRLCENLSNSGWNVQMVRRWLVLPYLRLEVGTTDD